MAGPFSSRPWCALLALVFGFARASAVLKRPTEAHALPSRVDKVYMTTALLRLQPRAHKTTSTCPTSYSLCPASLSGGCCPSNYGCEVDSCVQTSTSTATACGKAGYFNCGIDAGGGCCPQGYACGLSDCTPPAGASESHVCPTGYYLCPASYNYGCCQTGMGCASRACYATAPSTMVYTMTLTRVTDPSGKAAITTVTSTTVETPTAPSGVPTGATTVVPKFLPVSQTKTPEIAVEEDDQPHSAGLTKSQLGGLIGGLASLLVILLTAAFLVIRKLHKTAMLADTIKGASGSGGAGGVGLAPGNQQTGSGESGLYKPAMKHMHRPTASQIDRMEHDDLLETLRTDASVSVTSAGHHVGNTAAASSTGQPLEAGADNIGTASLIPAMAAAASSSGSGSGSSAGGAAIGDLPARVQNIPGNRSRTSTESQGSLPSHGLAQVSQTASIQSGLGSSAKPAELGVDGGIIPELPGSPDGTAGPSSAEIQQENRRLSVVVEMAENLHGHYGPAHAVVGQTRAGISNDVRPGSRIDP